MLYYDIKEIKGNLIIEGLRDFNPKHIFECGQSFRWKKEDDSSYTAIANKRLINIKKQDDYIIVKNTNSDEWLNFWHGYFDLDRDYSYIKQNLSYDLHLVKAMEFGEGMRLLNQDPFETTISFIIS